MDIKKVKKSLIEQLERNGANIPVFESLIEDYCRLFKVKENLLKDIETNGEIIEMVSSVGIEQRKQNPSTQEVLKVNAQMLKILQQLKLDIETCKTETDDEL